MALTLWGTPARSASPWELTGHDWKAMTESQKMAFLAGVIAGATATRARAEPGAADADMNAVVQELRRGGQLPLQYAPNVYKARVEDFYFYTDRLPTPVLKCLFMIERELRENAAPPR
jgi:hypothetical protein